MAASWGSCNHLRAKKSQMGIVSAVSKAQKGPLTHKDLPKYQVVVDVSGPDNAMHVLVRDTTTGLTTVTRINLPTDPRR